MATDELQPLLAALLVLPWGAIYSDTEDVDWGSLTTSAETRGDELVVRLFPDAAPTEKLPTNRLPIYLLRGSDGNTGPGDATNPAQLFTRFQKLQQAPPTTNVVFVLGAADDRDLAGLEEAAGLSPAFRRLVLVSPTPIDVLSLAAKTESITFFHTSVSAFRAALPLPKGAADRTNILIGPPHSAVAVDVTDCIDASSPITASFELITSRDVLTQGAISDQQTRGFFSNATSNWDVYRVGLPMPRHLEYRTTLTDRIKAFQREGSSASFTGWIHAEPGSGATTVLRALCFDLSRAGVPVLVARPAVDHFDFNQIAVFLTQATDRAAAVRDDSAATPWVLAFDVEHAQNHREFLDGLCNGLKKLHRSVVVVVVHSVELEGSTRRAHAHGDNRRLGGPLRNSVSTAEAVVLGDHLARFLPELRSRKQADWEAFISKTLVPKEASRRSLFWVALRFWLFQSDASGEAFRPWLARKLHEILGNDASAYAGVLEAAALATFRLTLPYGFLSVVARASIRRIARQAQNLLGVCEVQVGTTINVTLAHPMIAEEILRIAAQDPAALAAVEKPTCFSLFDLELHLLGRLVAHANAGHYLELVEDIATSALRVDPRISPRNFDHRDRIVAILEQAPDAVWDTSQIFNHHVAIARRHLATTPPSIDWTIEARREQLELAERHLLDALNNIEPRHERGRESPLNMRVSLALTYDARARLEVASGDETGVSEYTQKASRQYELAQMMDADNMYVLENFARFKLNRAEGEQDDVVRTKMVIEAIELLEVEMETDQASRRDEPVMQELARAYEMLQRGRGKAWLEEFCDAGNEAATVALARLVLGPPGTAAPPEALASAKALLDRLPAVAVTWRSRALLYRVVCQLEPHDFTQRLDVLRELVADGSFQWTMQLRLEYAILLFQIGGQASRQEGQVEFRKIREQLRERSGGMAVPHELKFLADPASAYQRPLKTWFRVGNTSTPGKTGYGIPNGWGAVQIAFRAHLFPIEGGRIRPGTELDCLIQFTNFGPQAVPVGSRID